jgi:hypothetical protein
MNINGSFVAQSSRNIYFQNTGRSNSNANINNSFFSQNSLGGGGGGGGTA